MATAERKVGISIILKDKMSSALGKADKKAKKLRDSGEQIAKSFKKAAKPFAVLAGVVTAVGAATFLLTKKVSEFGDQMIKGAQRLNLGTEAYQKFDHAMQLSGTSMEANKGALTRFARTARDAVNGVKVAEEAFTRLGISVRGNDGSFKQTEELMLEVSDAFKGMPSTIEKTALMMDLFGRSGAQMSQFLSLGSEGMKEIGDDAQRLGGIMSESAAKESEKFIDALTRMDLAFDGLARDIGGHTQPVFTKAMESIANSIVDLRRAFMPVYKDFMRNTKTMGGVVIPILGFIGKAVIGFGTAVVLTFKAATLTVNRAISGWIQINNTMLKAFEWVTGIKIAPLADDFKDTADEIEGEMGNIVDASAATMKAMDNLTNAVANTNTKIYTTGDAIDKARDAAGKLGTVSTELTAEEIAAREKLRQANKDYYEKIDKMRKASRDRNRELLIQGLNAEDDIKAAFFKKEFERNQKLVEKKKKDEEDLKASAIEGAQATAAAFETGFYAAEEGQNKLKEGFRSSAEVAIDSIFDIAQARAVEAAVGAASSQSAIPVIGPALAAAAAASILSMLRGIIKVGIKGMADGGFVTGGVPNRDSVPTMLMPGEYVMSKKEVAAAQGGGLGGSPTVNIELSSSLPPTRAEMKKFVRQNIVPALRELRVQGMY